MTEKTPCPTCDRLMKPRHTKGTDFMPRHLDLREGANGGRCAGSGAVVNARPVCEDCDESHCHKAVSDPAPTVEPLDDDREETAEPGRSSLLNDTKGPWFGAQFGGYCGSCADQLYEGDRIRADGHGGYECEDCGSFDDGMDRHVRQSLGIDEDNGAVPLPERQDAEIAAADWQAQASAAAKRYVTAQPGDTPYGAMLKAVLDPTPVVELRIPATPGPMPTADEFLDPTPAEDQEQPNVSGQPKARYEWRGSQNLGYLVVVPGLGDFRRYKNGKPKGLTRATTFNKAASDSKAINDWGKRNIVIGASRRPNVLLRAHGLTHESDRVALEGIVAELEEAAGAKVGSDVGTYLHGFTELMDAGLKTWRDAPEQYRESLQLYCQVLADAELEPVPGLIERTTMIQEFGGVVGTFDRIFYHRPSGTYVIGDLKTGKTMKYAMDETETQLWIYAHGVNQNGIYDWNTDTWGCVTNALAEPIAVREDVGVIIHMPVQGPEAGTVTLVHADLVAGAKHAELCHDIRSRPRSKVSPFVAPPVEPTVVELANPTGPAVWEHLFRSIQSNAEAGELWSRAKFHGVEPMELQRLVSIAQQVLTGKG